MDDKDLARLANIVAVRNHIFSLVNGATGFALTGFDKAASRQLNSVIGALDKEFVDGVLIAEPQPEISPVVAEKLDKIEKSVKARSPKASKKAKKKKSTKKSSVDPDLAKRLAEAKAAMAK